jgi:hypothetical protein
MAVFDAPRAPTASPRRRMAESFLLRLPATISIGSISRPAPPRSWSRPCRGKAHGASGATAAADCGLPVGTAEISSATTAETIVGSAGICRATGRSPTLSTSMTPMPCGSATGEQTRSFRADCALAGIEIGPDCIEGGVFHDHDHDGSGEHRVRRGPDSEVRPTLRWRKTDSNSRSLREGKGCGQSLQAGIAVSDLNL